MHKAARWRDKSQAQLQATPAGYDRFARDRLGISVHFGLYSIDASLEWTQAIKGIDTQEYARRMGRFNPNRFNADEWLDLFTAFGATSFMVTTKHHDGFCLFDSRHTDFKATNTPVGRDLIVELADACHRRDVAVHFYHSLIDWHHPLSAPPGDVPPRDFAGYCQYMLVQIEELCTQYGPVAGMLFDGWWPASKADADQTETVERHDWPLTQVYDTIHKLQPDCMITNNHHILPLPGEDYQVWEIDLPGENAMGFNCELVGDKPKMAWMTATQNGWSWQHRDDYRSAEQIVDEIRRAWAMDAVYQFNLGPMGDGRINPREAALLREVKAMGLPD